MNRIHKIVKCPETGNFFVVSCDGEQVVAATDKRFNLPGIPQKVIDKYNANPAEGEFITVEMTDLCTDCPGLSECDTPGPSNPCATPKTHYNKVVVVEPVVEEPMKEERKFVAECLNATQPSSVVPNEIMHSMLMAIGQSLGLFDYPKEGKTASAKEDFQIEEDGTIVREEPKTTWTEDEVNEIYDNAYNLGYKHGLADACDDIRKSINNYQDEFDEFTGEEND